MDDWSNVLDRVCMGCCDLVCWCCCLFPSFRFPSFRFPWGEMHSIFMSWCSELINALAVWSFFRYISCPSSGHSDSMQDTAGASLTRTRRSSISSVSAMFVMWLISVVSWCDWNSIWNVVRSLRFWPNSIQHEARSAGTCFTTHRRHSRVFIFRTKAPEIMMWFDWIGLWLFDLFALDGDCAGRVQFFFLIATFFQPEYDQQQ